MESKDFKVNIIKFIKLKLKKKKKNFGGGKNCASL